MDSVPGWWPADPTVEALHFSVYLYVVALRRLRDAIPLFTSSGVRQGPAGRVLESLEVSTGKVTVYAIPPSRSAARARRDALAKARARARRR